MNYKQIRRLQEEHGYAEMQSMIDSGMAWRMEGSYGRSAMAMLQSGACMLPKEPYRDYYGNTVPSRDWLEKGTKGTFQNSVRFWEN